MLGCICVGWIFFYLHLFLGEHFFLVLGRKSGFKCETHSFGYPCAPRSCLGFSVGLFCSLMPWRFLIHIYAYWDILSELPFFFYCIWKFLIDFIKTVRKLEWLHSKKLINIPQQLIHCLFFNEHSLLLVSRTLQQVSEYEVAKYSNFDSIKPFSCW